MSRSRVTTDHEAAHARARTVLAVCHEVWCDLLEESASTSVSLGLLDVGGQPVLVAQSASAESRAGRTVSCLAVLDDIGTVTFTGVLRAPVRAADDPQVGRALRDHRGCLVVTTPLDEIMVTPMDVLTVTVVVPGGVEEIDLDPERVRRAEPDWLLAQGARLVEHLENDHGDDLTRLARLNGVEGAVSVGITELTRDGATLACLTDDGVTSVRLPFAPSVTDPGQLWAQLAPTSARPGDHPLT